MKDRGHHLQEERLFDCYLAARGGEALDPPVAEHLTDCDDCGARYAELTEFMETLSTEAATEADAVFSPERLRAQRMHISRRLEHLGHPARVITFPGRTGGHHFGSSDAASGAPVGCGGGRRRAVRRRRHGPVPRPGDGPRIRPACVAGDGSPDDSHGARRSHREPSRDRARAARSVRVGRGLPLRARAGRRASTHPRADGGRRADAARSGSQSTMSGNRRHSACTPGTIHQRENASFLRSVRS